MRCLSLLVAVAAAIRPRTAYSLMADVFWSSNLRQQIVSAIADNSCGLSDLSAPEFHNLALEYSEMYARYSRLLYSFSGLTRLVESKKRLRAEYSRMLLPFFDECIAMADDLNVQTAFHAKTSAALTIADNPDNQLTQIVAPEATSCIRISICEAFLTMFCAKAREFCAL